MGSLTELYDSDSEGEISTNSTYCVQVTEPATTNGESVEEDFGRGKATEEDSGEDQARSRKRNKIIRSHR